MNSSKPRSLVDHVIKHDVILSLSRNSTRVSQLYNCFSDQNTEFLAENTSLTTKLISQKLDELEKMVKHGPQRKMDKLQRKNTMLEIDRELQRRNSQRPSSNFCFELRIMTHYL